jgi:hypothetical protein
MRAISTEKCIADGKLGLQNLFKFVHENAETMQSYEMELNISRLIQQIGLTAMQCYFADKGTGNIGPELKFENDLILKRENRLHGRNYFSIFGKFKVPRTCYRLKDYSGVMPLDAQADLPDRCYSYALQELMDFLSIRDSFDESQKTLEKFFGLNINSSRFEVISRDTNTSYDEYYEQKQPPSTESEGELQVVSFDGKGVPVIKRELAELKGRLGKGEKRQKKKEALVGVSYTVDKKQRSPEEIADNLIYPEKTRKSKDQNEVKAKNIRRMASLERTKTVVMDEIIRDAKNRDPCKSRPWVALLDGALHLWDKMDECLNGIEYTGILDIIHVVEYLYLAANALHENEQSDQIKKWVHQKLLMLLKGKVGFVIGGLKQCITKRELKIGQQKSINDTIRYFENHRQWMKYDEYLAAGYPIGTGVVESSCGHTVKNRMEGSGRRWSITGAESTLLLRSIYTSGDWDDYWQAHMKRERTLMNLRMFDGFCYTDDYEYFNNDLYLTKLTGT